jgi:ribokinase
MATVGVVGHVEWVEFALVDHAPAPGEIVVARETFADVGGGGGVAAVHLAQLSGAAPRLLTAVGSDALGTRALERLAELGVSAHAARRDSPQPRAVAVLSADGQRTITVLDPPAGPRGSDVLPWNVLANFDAVLLTAGDDGARYATRSAPIVVATAQAVEGHEDASIRLDARVLSAADAGHAELVARLARPPELVIVTEGARGGSWTTGDGRSGRWAPAPVPGPIVDEFGAGDAFVAAVTLALGSGLAAEEAVRYGAQAGALALTGRGPYGADLGGLGPPPLSRR